MKDFPRGSCEKTRAHYPKGLLEVATDVLTGVPLLARLASPLKTTERDLLFDIIGDLPKKIVVLLDRGHESCRVFDTITKAGSCYIARMRTRSWGLHHSGFVQSFLATGLREQVVTMENQHGLRTAVRLLRYGNDAEHLPIVLATNLFDRTKYPRTSILKAYKHRWRVETLYYRVKTLLHLESFHARTLNGIKQEVWAQLFVLGVTAVLVQKASRSAESPRAAINFKSVVEIVRRNLRILMACSHRLRTRLLKQLLAQIEKLRCRKQPGRKYERRSRRPQNSWRRPDGKNRARVQDARRRANASA